MNVKTNVKAGASVTICNHNETLVRSRKVNDKENSALPPKEGKRRFQMVRLEERVAPATTRYFYQPETSLTMPR
jgi:hypothetical protein